MTTAARSFADRVNAYWDGLIVAAGPSFGCDDCGLGEVAQDDQAAQDAYDAACSGHFSWAPCPSCGGLAGDRYAVHHWDPNDEQSIVGHTNVCPDCLCYLANGDLPQDDA